MYLLTKCFYFIVCIIPVHLAWIMLHASLPPPDLVFCVHFRLDRECNPSLLSLVSSVNISTIQPTPTSAPGIVQWWDAQGIVGLVIFLFCTFYARYSEEV